MLELFIFISFLFVIILVFTRFVIITLIFTQGGRGHWTVDLSVHCLIPLDPCIYLVWDDCCKIDLIMGIFVLIFDTSRKY